LMGHPPQSAIFSRLRTSLRITFDNLALFAYRSTI
jgi:hypothetical protein